MPPPLCGRKAVLPTPQRVGYQPVTPDRQAFLQARPWWCPAYHAPWQTRVSERYPGTHVVAHPDAALREAEGCAEDDLRCWEATPNNVLFVPVEPGCCHDNVAALQQQTDGACAWWTGYALSADGLWRHHSWGWWQNRIVETTVPRLVYWGLPVKKA